MKPTFFKTSSLFRAWLHEHHLRMGELWVGYYKKKSGKPSLTWPESVDEAKSGIYSYEQRTVELHEPYNRLLRKNQRAWKFFHARPPSYRKAVSWWIISAKKEETRLKRLEKLIACSVRSQKLPEMTPRKPAR